MGIGEEYKVLSPEQDASKEDLCFLILDPIRSYNFYFIYFSFFLKERDLGNDSKGTAWKESKERYLIPDIVF